jgi:hypothetical protein
VSEAQYVGLAVAQGFQQHLCLAFTGAVAVAGGGRQPDPHALDELGDQPVLEVFVDGILAGLAGQVDLVDQSA